MLCFIHVDEITVFLRGGQKPRVCGSHLISKVNLLIKTIQTSSSFTVNFFVKNYPLVTMKLNKLVIVNITINEEFQIFHHG